jgi:hypothetical protein
MVGEVYPSCELPDFFQSKVPPVATFPPGPEVRPASGAFPSGHTTPPAFGVTKRPRHWAPGPARLRNMPGHETRVVFWAATTAQHHC